MALTAAEISALIIAEDAVVYNTGETTALSLTCCSVSINGVVAASMFIFWDHCITFGQEVRIILLRLRQLF